jgi:RHH-type proline utilization regulon transcriptional repressor/proline dehydrogenase/delta 1-pyrroline-5-carboxylate dehydrogenase
MAFFWRNKQHTTLAATGRDVESLTRQIGSQLLSSARSHGKGMFSSRFWSDKLMDWATKDEAFKVQLFRFVDAFPMLKTPEQVHEHLIDYLSQPGVTTPPGMSLGLKAGGLLKGTLASTMSRQITGMAEKFIVGVDAASALPTLEKLWKGNRAFSVDLLGELCVSDEEAAAYQKRYLDLIESLPTQVASWTANPILESDHLSAIPRTNVSIKISSLYARTNPIDPEGSVDGLLDALTPILLAAERNYVTINFDMESHAFKDLTILLFQRACEKINFPAAIAIQAYLKSGEQDVQKIIDFAHRTGRQVGVRLIKGAYWDYEVINAEQKGWPIPVWETKAETDACFERMSAQIIAQTPRNQGQGGVKLALGSHNARSIAHALAQLRAHDLPDSALELQMLYGMADELKSACVEMNLRLREYVPVGEMIPGMAYLVRRLLENTSNESWLKAGFLDNASEETLLATPVVVSREPKETPASRHNLSRIAKGVGDNQPFFTEPVHDWCDSAQREAFARAIAHVQVPVVRNDGTINQAKEATSRAYEAFPAWRDKDPVERANLLIHAASILRSRRDELAGVMIEEAGKPWSEADADVCEAIDFCEYYARESVHLFQRERLGKFVGELNEQWYQPRGVCAVISPWNFPLAICCGMTVAALVTGNTAIVKPAEQTPAIARILCEILWQAGIPRDVLQFLPGQGGTVGAALVRDPRIAIIAFTGSKAVGLDILSAAGVTPEDQPFVKKVICEMGGKNAILIDASADLDEAVLGVRQSAFGFAGQKCSACSRAIVVETAHDAFLHRLVESTRALVVGDPMHPSTDVGPVIDEDAAKKIRSYIQLGKQEAKLELSLPVPDGLEAKTGRHFVGPTIFSNVVPDHRIANEEIFGPVLAVMKVRDFDEALLLANATSYKLTGGVYSRKPSNLERAKREFRVGNLYLNRGITGALVGRQPFGGFGLSGVGSKAGGGDYLLQFVEPRACTENTMRRGFAPGIE